MATNFGWSLFLCSSVIGWGAGLRPYGVGSVASGVQAPQIITTVDRRIDSHIYAVCGFFFYYYQFLSQKFGNFKGGGKFVVTIIALIYAYGNLQIYNIIGLYAPYTNRVIFNKIRNNSLWHTLCILMIICDLTQKHKKSLSLITILYKFT